MPYAAVTVRVGGRSWDFYPETGVADDEVTVLSSARFGWSMPGPLYPGQPTPMTANLTLNVPDFSTLGNIVEGIPVGIIVAQPSGFPAEFYGRVTDCKAKRRRGATGRGMNVTITAVDYTVDRGEQMPEDFGFPELTYDHSVVGTVLEGGADGIWTSGVLLLRAPQGKVNHRDVVAQVLNQAVHLDNRTRMIVSPYIIDGDLAPAPVTGRPFTLDTISADTTSTLVIPAKACELDVEWSSSKGLVYDGVIASGYGGSGDNAVVAWSSDRGITTETISVTYENVSDAQAVADFYALHEWRRWQPQKITVRASHHDDDPVDPYSAPIGSFFPHWPFPESDTARGSCYSRRIEFDGVVTTQQPPGGGGHNGRLVGAELTIAHRELTLELSIRREAS